jgi:L-rhamnose mutarotase
MSSERQGDFFGRLAEVEREGNVFIQNSAHDSHEREGRSFSSGENETRILYAADMAKVAADPTTQKWWSVCMPCQKPVENRASGEWWASMEEVFHLD